MISNQLFWSFDKFALNQIFKRPEDGADCVSNPHVTPENVT